MTKKVKKAKKKGRLAWLGKEVYPLGESERWLEKEIPKFLDKPISEIHFKFWKPRKVKKGRLKKVT